jgi:DNA-binding transcriptional regulator YiaG
MTTCATHPAVELVCPACLGARNAGQRSRAKLEAAAKNLRKARRGRRQADQLRFRALAKASPRFDPTVPVTGAVVRGIRGRFGLTQAQLARRLELTPATIAAWETDRWPIPKRRELALRKVFVSWIRAS